MDQMIISIAERFRPYVKAPGVPCILPYSKLRVKAYPSYLEIEDLSHSVPVSVAKMKLNVRGPVKDFTVMQDLERGSLLVWGESLDGFFRYRLAYSEKEPGFEIKIEKGSIEFNDISEKIPGFEDRKNILSETVEENVSIPHIPRLSFGVTKKADWTLVNRRFALSEILPFWFRLGRLLPNVINHAEGSAWLLQECEDAMTSKDPVRLAKSFETVYSVGFYGLLSSHLEDAAHQGVMLPPISKNPNYSPLILLAKGADLIQNMLISEVENGIAILPCLLPELHAGRFIHVSLEGKGEIDLEWSKKKARRLIFRSSKEQALTFHFSHGLKTFRLRTADGIKLGVKECNRFLNFAANTTYYFDRFEK